MRVELVEGDDDAVIDVARWESDDLDFWAFDRLLDAADACDAPVRVPRAIAVQVLTRAQRLRPRCNPASSVPWFASVLARHRARHDLTRPLVLADYDHALDAWQWALRLSPDATASVQLAALLHDVERLVSEAEQRVEHLAADYQTFKDAHARAGAKIAKQLLDDAGVPPAVQERTVELIAEHERAGADREAQVVADADALSFFSLNSPGYLAYFGPDQTERKVAYTLARMSRAARGHLHHLRLPRVVADAITRSHR